MRSKHIKIDKRIGVNFMFFMLMSFTFLRYGMAIDIPISVLLLIALLIISVGNNNEIIALCMCCIPLYSAFDYLYAIVYASIILIIKNWKKIKVDFTVIVTLTLFMWELLHSFGGDFSFKHLIAMIMPYILVVIIHMMKKEKLDYYYIGMMFARFVSLVGINLFVRVILMYGNNIAYAIRQMGRLGNVDENSGITGGNINPNELGIMCVLAITILVQIYLYQKKEIKGIMYIILLLILGLLTLSRTYIVLILGMFTLFLIDQKDNYKKNLKIIFFAGILLVFISIVLTNVFPTVINNFETRWLEEDISNGRVSIMSDVSEVIWSNSRIFLFGIGLQNYSNKARQVVSIPPHDSFHEILMAWGLPGLFLFMLFIIAIIIGAHKRINTKRLGNYIPLLILFAKAIAGHWITSSYSMLTITLTYLSLIQNFETNLGD